MSHPISPESRVGILHDDEIRRLCAGADDGGARAYFLNLGPMSIPSGGRRAMLNQAPPKLRPAQPGS
jgi:hypothetical protein